MRKSKKGLSLFRRFYQLRFKTTLPLHLKASKNKYYKKWHDYKFSHHVHVATAVFAFGIMAFSAVLNLVPSKELLLAANGNWSQASFAGTGDGTYTNTQATGGDLALTENKLSNDGGGDWGYRKKVTINNSAGGALTDYQVAVDSEKDLVGHWNFDETSGTAYDSSWNSRNGSVVGPNQNVSGRYGNGVSFDGVNDYVDFGDVNEAEGTSGTYEAWVKPTGASGNNVILSKSYTTGTIARWLWVGTNYVSFQMNNGTWYTASSPAGSISPDIWYHVVATWGSAGMKLYLNGDEVGSNAFTGNGYISSYSLVAGDWKEQLAGTYSLNGSLDEIKVYNKAISSTEVWQEYHQQKPLLFDDIKPDGSDIRFTDSDGKTELPYWIESFNNSSTGKKNYKVWVKTNVPASSSKDIYMHYGNPNATSSANGDNVFEFFDDFEGSIIDSTKWVTSGEVTVAGGAATITAALTSPSYMKSKVSQQYGVMEYRATSVRHQYYTYMIWGENTTTEGRSEYTLNGGNLFTYCWLNGLNTGGSKGAFTAGSETRWTQKRQAGRVDFYRNGILDQTTTSNTPTGAGPIFFITYKSGSSYDILNVNWIFFRQFATTEPTITESGGLARQYYKKDINFNTTATGANVATAQYDFPIAVHINSSSMPDATERSHFFGDWNVGGKRAQFWESDESFALDYEVEYYDQATQEAIYWVRVPKVDGNSSTDKIKLAYGRSPGADQVNGTGVWINGYVFVYHHADSSNSVSSSYPLTVTGATTTTSSLGISHNLDGTNDYLNNNYLISDNIFTIEVYGQKRDNQYNTAWIKGYYVSSADSNYNVLHFEYNDNLPEFGTRLNETAVKAKATQTIDNNNFNYLVGTKNGASIALFVNDTEKVTNTGAPSPNTGSYAWYTVQNPNNKVYYTNALMSETRYSAFVRSDDWIKLTYNSLKSTTFNGDAWLSYGTESSANYTIIGYQASGTFVTGAIPETAEHQNKVYGWGALTFAHTLNGGTVTYDILNGETGNPITGYIGITTTPTDISGINPLVYPSLKVRANLAGDGNSTPTVDSIGVSYSYDVTAPTVPTGLTLGTVTSSSIALSWTASTDTESGLHSTEPYIIERSTDSGGLPTTWTEIGATSTNSHNATGLSANTKYYFRVKARDAVGNMSNPLGELTTDANTLGLWHLNEGVGTSTLDSSVNNVTGTMSGSNYWAIGTKLYNGFLGDGASNSVILADNPLDVTTNDFTISAWIKTTLSGAWSGVYTKGSGGAVGYGLWVDPNGYPDLGIQVSANLHVKASQTVNDGNWHHVVVVANRAGNADFYIDGQLRNAANTNISGQSGTLANATVARIGRAATSTASYFNGQIDEVQVSNIARTTEEIQNYYNAMNFGALSATTLVNTPTISAPTTFQNVTKPTISGSGATPSTSVRLYNNGTQMASVTADGSGNFTFNASTPGYTDFADGEHTNVTVRGFGTGGETADSAPRTVHVDTDPPEGPSAATAKEGSAIGADLINNDWNQHNNGPTVYFEWSGANDLPFPPNSSIKRHWVYFGSNANALPRTDGEVTPDAQPNATKTLSNPQTGTDYYLRVQSEDEAGNISNDVDVATIFTYKFDDVAPTPVPNISVTPAGWSSEDPFTFTWSDGADAESGLYGYEYKRNNGTDGWTRIANANPNTVNIDHYQTGVNYFLLATIDRAGNQSTPVNWPYLYSGNVGAPQNLLVDLSQSQGQTINNFKFTWNPPTVGNTVGYYYSINSVPSTENSVYTEDAFTDFSQFAKANGVSQTFYVVAKDEFGNVGWNNFNQTSFVVNTVAPGVPLSISITDTSNRNTNQYALTLMWVVPETVTTDFSHYVVERSTDGTNFVERATIEKSNTGYLDTGLSNSTDYFYRVKSKDNVGNTSDQTAVVHKIPTGKYTVPPTFTSEPSSDAKAMSVKINWTTNRASNTVVQYGTTTSYGQEASKSTEAVTDHSIEILGLTPGVTYHYRVQSLDAERDYDPNSAFSADFTFSTQAAPGISNVEVSEIRLTSVILTWKTTSSATSKILYGTTTTYGKQYVDNSGSSVTTHTVKIKELSDSTTYNFKIQGTDVDGNNLLSDNYVFTTLTFPKLSNFKVEQVKNTATSTVKVKFSSNVPTTANVNVSGNGGKESAQYNLKTSHEMTIAGLKDNTSYNIIASARDQYGNEADTISETYKTEFDTRPPQISNITTETSIIGYGLDAKGQVIISWTTDEPASSQIEYGAGATGGEYSAKTQEDLTLSENHVIILSDLKASSPYHFRVISRDNAGNKAQSQDNSVLTDQATESIIDIIIKSLQSSIGWIFNAFNR